ncbi:MAG: MinD/ParA family protein [Firmicutes bacterium]|jgi:flagellar biosynthesis protein FlhG|nr:MinD/ParA family protein [Bacillota bacterium]
MADQAEHLRALFHQHRISGAPRKRGLSRIIVVASGKGGVGKSNIVVNLAIVFGQLGRKIIILDTDVGMANVDVLLNLKPGYTLVDVIKGKKELSEVILRGPYNVEIVPGGSGFSEMVNLDNHQREQLISRLSYLEEKGDILLIDCAAGLSRDILSFIAAADELVVVTTPEPTALTDVYSIIKIVNNCGLKSRVNLVVNMAHGMKEAENVYGRLENVCRNYLDINLYFLGAIEYDLVVRKAVLDCSPYVLKYPNSRVSQCTRDIAQRLLAGGGGYSPAPKKEEGFLKRLIRMWR